MMTFAISRKLQLCHTYLGTKERNTSTLSIPRFGDSGGWRRSQLWRELSEYRAIHLSVCSMLVSSFVFCLPAWLPMRGKYPL